MAKSSSRSPELVHKPLVRHQIIEWTDPSVPCRRLLPLQSHLDIGRQADELHACMSFISSALAPVNQSILRVFYRFPIFVSISRNRTATCIACSIETFQKISECNFRSGGGERTATYRGIDVLSNLSFRFLSIRRFFLLLRCSNGLCVYEYVLLWLAESKCSEIGTCCVGNICR